jgi:hypothetical protein
VIWWFWDDMETTHYNGCQLRIGLLPASRFGAYQAVFTGPFSQSAFDFFSPIIADQLQNAPAALVRMDTALDVSIAPTAPSTGFPGKPSMAGWATVCHESQYPKWLEYSKERAAAGFRRAVFVPSQLDLALQWVEWQAQACH